MIYSKPELVAITTDIANSEHIDPAFVCSVADVLSSWNPALVEQSMDPQQFNPALARQDALESRLGLLQISSSAAKELGYTKETQQDLLSPTLNVLIGCKLLKKALAQCGQVAERSLLVVYGYSVASLIPRIRERVPIYEKFLAQKPA